MVPPKNTLQEILAAISAHAEQVRQGLAENLGDMAQHPWEGLTGGHGSPLSDAVAGMGHSVAQTLQQMQQHPIDAMSGMIGPGELGMIHAYHGTPHNFDRFDLSKIGTGEGNQAYGHGLYFTDKPSIAQHYRDKLSKNIPNHVIAALKAEDNFGFDSPRQAAGAILQHPDWMHRWPLENQQAIPMLEQWRSDRLAGKQGGAVYKVDLDVNDEDLMNWDQSMSAQSPGVRQRLAEAKVIPKDPAYEAWQLARKRQDEAFSSSPPGALGGAADPHDYAEAYRNYQDATNEGMRLKDELAKRGIGFDQLLMTGEQAYRKANWQALQGRLHDPYAHYMTETDPLASQYLLQHDIPGHRYRTGATRNDWTLPPDWNYVMYSDQPIQITGQE